MTGSVNAWQCMLGRLLVRDRHALRPPLIFLASYATQYWQLLAIGLLPGIVGASFAVGTPYCARLFP